MATNPKVVVFGSCMIDLVCYCARLPKPGETIHGTDFKMGYGGKGANQCVAASKLGASTALVARLGDDFFGQDYKKYLNAVGINTDYVYLTEGITSGMAQITVSENAENIIVIVAGANNKLSVEDAIRAKDILLNAKIAIFQFEAPIDSTVKTLELIKMDGGGPVTIVNGAPATKEIDHKIYQLSDIFCVNETEAEEMTGLHVTSVSEAITAIEKFQSFGCGTVIITLGAKGAVFAEKGSKPSHISAPSVSAVDTTGAGDAFIGALAFLTATCPETSLTTRVSRACKIASKSVMTKGTQTSFPNRTDLPEEFFANSDEIVISDVATGTL